MEEELKIISDLMAAAGIPYAYGEWSGDITYPYWVGEISESEPYTEDGATSPILILTGTQRGPWKALYDALETIKELFPISGYRFKTDKGSALSIFYAGTLGPIPTGEADLKRLQVNLKIMKWSEI